jgi:IclR family KDG regulon transcriptional repressor
MPVNKKPKHEYAIQTVTNALRLLQAFRDEDELGVTELSRRLGLHKNNVFRLLATLELENFIEQSADTERYRLGTRSLELGQAFHRGRDLLRRARPILKELAGRFEESAHLASMEEFAVVHLDGESSDRLVSTSTRIGRHLPLHCTALGKMLLGSSREALRGRYDREVVAGGSLEARTPATITDPHKFFEEIRGAAVQGFAIDLEECAEGLCCVAAPVLDETGEVIAALSLSGPAFRMGEKRLLGEVAPGVVAAAERLSRELGYAI